MTPKILNITSSERGLFAEKSFNDGEIVTMLEGNTLNYPTRTSIQVGEYQHMESELGGFMNHHCEPNCKIIVGSWQDVTLKLNGVGIKVEAIQNIKEGDELTFNYNETEHNISNPFNCRCHDKPITGGRPNA